MSRSAPPPLKKKKKKRLDPLVIIRLEEKLLSDYLTFYETGLLNGLNGP